MRRERGVKGEREEKERGQRGEREERKEGKRGEGKRGERKRRERGEIEKCPTHPEFPFRNPRCMRIKSTLIAWTFCVGINQKRITGSSA